MTAHVREHLGRKYPAGRAYNLIFVTNDSMTPILDVVGHDIEFDNSIE